MKRYVKVFLDKSEYSVTREANDWAEKYQETIISASLTIRPSKNGLDWHYLVVVFEKEG
jgi:hypothetical protein